MNLTLHITDECNMRCAYCVHDYSAKRMSLTTAVAAVDLSICSKDDPLIPSGCKHTGLCFYGGEPLLNRDLIEKTVAYCDTLRAGKGEVFYYLLVTNGTLMDESFLEFAAAHDIGIGLSHDGLMQEDSRRMEDGTSSADRLEETIDLLLRYRPKATAMCTIHPPLVDRFAESVRWLFGKGFRKVQTVPAVGIKADWTPGRMEELEKQYLLLSDFYAEKTRAGDDFELTLFENKIRSHIMDGRGINQTCRFGKRQLSVAPDGAIYPCVQFLDLPEYRMGDVFDGLIPENVARVAGDGGKEPVECQTCALRKRCKYNCCCMNRITTGSIDEISPLTCAFERLAIRYADRAANMLMAEGDPHFIKKHYTTILGKDPMFFE
ncbi:MAG: SPASM domain-containing protein [Clostridiaceae bacterium]|jgi:uncharacterized protein|nr:SPASM domain-containing protein [Oscillospiraceae bacterium]NLO62896.1 SPASM domain-containing protein [Clostridiaceae bacterium]